MFSKKRSKGLKFLLSFLLLAGWAFQSCTDEGIIDAPTWHQTVEHGDNALVRDAKAMVDGTQGNLSMPDMFKTLGKAQTRAANSEPQTLASGSFTLDWEAAQSLYEEDGTVLLVPIRMKQNMAIWRFTVINNKRKAEQTPMHSVLYVKKFDSTGNIMGRVLSYAPSRQYIKRHPKYHQRLEGYNPDHTDYSGLLLVSSLDGNLSHGFNYENGCRQFMFRPNTHAYEHSHGQESASVTRALALPDSCQHNHATDQKTEAIHSTVFSMRMISSTSAVSTYSYNNETGGQLYCSFCYKPVDDCVCLIVDGDKCENCKKLLKDCVCPCPFCNSHPCKCNNTDCIFCKKYPCICESTVVGGGGGNNNSSNNGNNNNQGGSSVGGGNNNTSTPKPVHVGKQAITDAAKYSVDEVVKTDKKGERKAKCNKGVLNAFKKLFNNSTELDNKRANDMVRHWIASSNWIKIELHEAQEYANNGYFTVAGWINTSLRSDGSEESGHVAVVVPGAETYSSSWETMVPCTMDTGFNMRNPKQKLSQSFGKNKKDNVQYFIYSTFASRILMLSVSF